MSFNDGFSTKGIATPPVAPVSGNALVYDGTNWVAGTVSGGGGTGDITSVTAGTNLTGGGTSGDVTVSLNTSVTGLTNLQATSITGSFSGNLNGTASFATNAASASSTVYRREWHVSTGSGNDITGNGTLLSPYRTLGAAITAASAQGGDQIVLHPGTFIEDVTMGKINTTICAAQGSNGGEVNISGTMTVSQSIAPNSSIRLFGIAVSNLIHDGTGSLYLENCKVNNTFTKATTAYFQATSCDFNKDILIVSGGTTSFQGGNQSASGSSFIINNPGAIVLVRDSITTCSPIVVSGTLGINDCAVTATSSGGPAITSLAPGTGSIVIMVDSTTVDISGSSTKVAIGGLFSYSNSVFNKTASTLGANLPSIADFDIVRVNTITGSTALFTTVTGSTVTGSTARFTVVTGSTVTGSTALFTTITGSTVTGSTALFTTITGSTVTGSIARFTTITGSNIEYIAAVSGNWSGTAPTTIKDAIDRLAARLFTISGSIP
jgi:hypothetical protein